MLGYCTWNEVQNLSPILESALNQKFKEFSLFSGSFSKNSSFQKAFQVPLKSKIKFQGFSRTSRSSMNLDINLKHAGSNAIALFSKKNLCDKKTASCKQNMYILCTIQILKVKGFYSSFKTTKMSRHLYLFYNAAHHPSMAI